MPSNLLIKVNIRTSVSIKDNTKQTNKKQKEILKKINDQYLQKQYQSSR